MNTYAGRHVPTISIDENIGKFSSYWFEFEVFFDTKRPQMKSRIILYYVANKLFDPFYRNKRLL